MQQISGILRSPRKGRELKIDILAVFDSLAGFAHFPGRELK